MPRSRAPRPPPLCRKSCTSSTGLRLIQVRQNSTEGISWKFSPSSSAGVFGFSWTTGSSAIPVPVSRCPRSSAAAAYVRPAGRRRRAPRTPQSLDNPTGWRASNIWWPTCRPGQVAVLLVLTQAPLSLFIRKSRAVTDSQSIGESIQLSGSSGSAFCREGVRSPLRPRPRSDDVSPQLVGDSRCTRGCSIFCRFWQNCGPGRRLGDPRSRGGGLGRRLGAPECEE